LDRVRKREKDAVWNPTIAAKPKPKPASQQEWGTRAVVRDRKDSEATRPVQAKEQRQAWATHHHFRKRR